MKKVFIFALLLALSACAYVDPSITDQTKIYSDAPVRKSALQVSVHPKGKQYRPLTAYFHPFVIQQQNSDYMHLSSAFAQIFYGAWLEDRLFTTMELQPDVRYEGLAIALERARRRGADLLILGSVPYFFAGHTLDDTAITIKIDIYAATSGMLIWSMMQSGRIEDKFPDDYIYFRHETRLSDSPFNMLIRDIAKDMTIPLKAWLPDPDTDFQFAQNTQDMKVNLKGGPDMNAVGLEKPVEKDLPNDTTMQNNALAHDIATQFPQENGVNLDIEFDFDKATIRSKSLPLLDSLGEALNSDELKGKNIIVGGHTDAKGTVAYNLTLSKQRAEAVKAYLVEKWSIPSDLIEAVGYGKSRPITAGKTPEERQKNRRVEIRLAQ